MSHFCIQVHTIQHRQLAAYHRTNVHQVRMKLGCAADRFKHWIQSLLAIDIRHTYDLKWAFQFSACRWISKFAWCTLCNHIQSDEIMRKFWIYSNKQIRVRSLKFTQLTASAKCEIHDVFWTIIQWICKNCIKDRTRFWVGQTHCWPIQRLGGPINYRLILPRLGDTLGL